MEFFIQKANEFITNAEPWKKWKDESTKQEAVKDLQMLLTDDLLYIKQRQPWRFCIYL